MKTSIIPQEIVSVKLQVGYGNITKLHPTLKVQKSLKRNTQPSYNKQYEGYFRI